MTYISIIIYGGGTHWLFTGKGLSNKLAAIDAVRQAEKYVKQFEIKQAFERRRFQ